MLSVFFSNSLLAMFSLTLRMYAECNFANSEKKSSPYPGERISFQFSSFSHIAFGDCLRSIYSIAFAGLRRPNHNGFENDL